MLLVVWRVGCALRAFPVDEPPAVHAPLPPSCVLWRHVRRRAFGTCGAALLSGAANVGLLSVGTWGGCGNCILPLVSACVRYANVQRSLGRDGAKAVVGHSKIPLKQKKGLLNSRIEWYIVMYELVRPFIKGLKKNLGKY